MFPASEKTITISVPSTILLSAPGSKGGCGEGGGGEDGGEGGGEGGGESGGEGGGEGGGGGARPSLYETMPWKMEG